MKKLISVLLVVASVSSLVITASASNINQKPNKFVGVYVQDISEELYEKRYEIAQCWTDLVENKEISVQEDGKFALKSNRKLDEDMYQYISCILDAYNDAINVGALKVSADTDNKLQYVLQNVDEKTISELQKKYGRTSQLNTSPSINDKLSPRVRHYCSRTSVDLLALCSSNYNTLKNFYWSSFILTLTNPYINAWETTAVYWVNKVREKGDWDYKTQPGYSPWNKAFCAYYDGYYHHITSEYIGNFNYGYTGSYLFSLSVLHAGSYAVSGFDAADIEDWPAIDDGYNHAP